MQTKSTMSRMLATTSRCPPYRPILLASQLKISSKVAAFKVILTKGAERQKRKSWRKRILWRARPMSNRILKLRSINSTGKKVKWHQSRIRLRIPCLLWNPPLTKEVSKVENRIKTKVMSTMIVLMMHLNSRRFSNRWPRNCQQQKDSRKKPSRTKTRLIQWVKVFK